MPVTAGHLLIDIRFVYLGQKCLVTSCYRTDGAAFLTATMDTVLEAYWNDIKALWRSLMSSSLAVNSTNSLYGREIGGGETYAEYAIPTGERNGTLGAGDDGEWVTGTLAVASKLVVSTFATNPGGKRLPFLREGDITGNVLTGAAITKYAPVFAIWAVPRLLGAPVATGVLHPAIGGTRVAGLPTVFQDVTGNVLNNNVSSQVSRKAGHGQ